MDRRTVLVHDGADTDVWRLFVEREALCVADEVAPPGALVAYDAGRMVSAVDFGGTWTPPAGEWLMVLARGNSDVVVRRVYRRRDGTHPSGYSEAWSPAWSEETAQRTEVSAVLMRGPRVARAFVRRSMWLLKFREAVAGERGAAHDWIAARDAARAGAHAQTAAMHCALVPRLCGAGAPPIAKFMRGDGDTALARRVAAFLVPDDPEELAED